MALRLSRFSRKFPQSLSALSIVSRSQTLNPFDPLPRSQTLEAIHPFLFSSTNPRVRSTPPHRRILDGFGHSLSLASISSSSSGTAKDENRDQRPRDSSSTSSWIDLYLPAAVRPYALLARLDKPIGTWLLAWPCIWYLTSPISM